MPAQDMFSGDRYGVVTDPFGHNSSRSQRISRNLSPQKKLFRRVLEGGVRPGSVRLANPASIVLTTSINAHMGMPTSSIYAAFKGALLSLAKFLSGIRVNAVRPTLRSRRRCTTNSGCPRATSWARFPSGPSATPPRSRPTIVFLASDEAPFTVGSQLVVDGGMSTL